MSKDISTHYDCDTSRCCYPGSFNYIYESFYRGILITGVKDFIEAIIFLL